MTEDKAASNCLTEMTVQQIKQQADSLEKSVKLMICDTLHIKDTDADDLVDSVSNWIEWKIVQVLKEYGIKSQVSF